MPGQRLREYLDSNKVQYTNILHTPAYTAQGVAHSAHISGKVIAKTVIVKSDDEMIMVVMPANQKVNLEQCRKFLHAAAVELASEEEFQDCFPDCEPGAMPPFGNLYDMKVFVSEELRGEEIAFNAGTHTELIQMKYQDFERLVQPQVVSFSGEDE